MRLFGLAACASGSDGARSVSFAQAEPRPLQAQATVRNRNEPGNRNDTLGFRFARTRTRTERRPACWSSERMPNQRSPARRRSRDGRVAMRAVADGGPAGRHPLADGIPPPWAVAWGRDHFGLFVTFAVEGVDQTLRWSPPGRFVMGSPEDEPGRYDDEGPRHEVLIQEGFWLFETPCTQALWQAVMGENPSRFPSPDRPVEQVNWNQVQDFIAKINARVPGLALTLPSEAQWEYACRAGTDTALYTGPIQILGENNAPALDPIAWYGGNSGVDFDLADGWDSSGWKEKQHPHERAGTRPVGRKRPNPWGLYDMLGNVWEWCADHWHERYDGATTDGTAWIDPGAAAGALRVVRGGSWRVYAGFVRAAVRNWFGPGDRNGTLGFRCARVPK